MTLPAPKKTFDIEVMVRDPDWLDDKDISVAQVSILKGIYGLGMTKEEREAFLEMTEGRPPRKGGYFETTLCIGVRSGKTEKIGSNVALYQAITFDRKAAGLAPGEVPYLGIIAQDREGASQIFGYIEGKSRALEDKGIEILATVEAQARAVTGQQIRFASGAVAQAFPSKKAATRNKTMILGLADELAWWETEEASVNADYEICRALKQRMTTVRPWAKLIKHSSPYTEHGVLYDDYLKRATAKRLFAQTPSWAFNPNIDPAVLSEARSDDPEGFLRDYGAQFGKAGGAYYTEQEIDGSMREDRPLIMPPEQGKDYRAWIDTAFKHDLFTVAIGFRHGDEVVYPIVRYWVPAKGAPLDDKQVAKELAEILRAYRIDSVKADQYADVPFANDLRNYDIRLETESKTSEASLAMHKNFKAAMRRGLVNLPKDEMIRKDVLACRKMGSGNQIKIAAPRRKGFHDDITKVVAALAQDLLPVGTVVDIAALNAGASRERTPQTYVDWRRREDERPADEELTNIMEAIL